MTSDPDTYRAAKLLMDRNGKAAGVVAAQRETELAAKGDIEGVTAWRAIRCAIEELQRGRQPGEVLNYRQLARWPAATNRRLACICMPCSCLSSMAICPSNSPTVAHRVVAAGNPSKSLYLLSTTAAVSRTTTRRGL
jgi:hypothetical protein